MSGMRFMLGCKTDNFVILGSDKAAFAYDAITVSEENDKNVKLGDYVTMTCIGEGAEVNNFCEWVQNNLRLNKMRYGYELSPSATHFRLRKTIDDGIKSGKNWRVDVLLGGYDVKDNKTWFSSIDSMGNVIENQSYIFHGVGEKYSYAVMKNIYRKDMTIEECAEALKKCIEGVKKHCDINLQGFNLLVIDQNGTRSLDDN